MSEQKKITISLSIEETNLLLESLGSLPFNRVYQLIGKIQQEAAIQLNGNGQMPLSKSEETKTESEETKNKSNKSLVN